MVVWSVAVMCTTLRLRVRSKSSPGAGRGHPPFQAVLVDADLAVDRAQVVSNPGQVLQHPVAMREQQLEAFGLVAVALATELGVRPDGPDRHTRGAKSRDHGDPGEVEVAVPSVAGAG